MSYSHRHRIRISFLIVLENVINVERSREQNGVKNQAGVFFRSLDFFQKQGFICTDSREIHLANSPN